MFGQAAWCQATCIQHKQSTPTGLSQRGNRDDLDEKEQ